MLDVFPHTMALSASGEMKRNLISKDQLTPVLGQTLKEDSLMFRTWMVNLVFASLAMLPLRADAVEISLDFEGAVGMSLDGTDLFMYTNMIGLNTFELTLSATGGDFNKTSSGFGINAPGAGDDTDAFDNGLVSESMRIAFSTTANVGVKIVSLEFDRLTGTGGAGEDQALLTFYDENDVLQNSVAVTNANTAGDDTANFNSIDFPELIFQPGSYFDLSVTDGNGFGIEVLVVDIDESFYTGGGGSGGGGAVPEPAAACLMLIGFAALCGYRRRK